MHIEREGITMIDHGAWAYSDEELAEFENEKKRYLDAAVAFARGAITDLSVRREYIQQAEDFAAELRQQISLKRLSRRAAAQQAHELRNILMDAMRSKTSAFGLEIAKLIKKTGKSMAELEEYYATKLFNTAFEHLAKEQRDKVWCEIVAGAGRPRLAMSNFVYWFSKAGKTVFALTVIVTVHHVTRSEHPVRTLTKDVASLGGAVSGAAILAPAGVAFGPFSLVIVPVFIFIGGVAGAFGAEQIFDRLWGAE